MALPYVTSAANIHKVIAAIKKAAVPNKITGEFVKTTFQIKGGGGDQITSFIKKIGLVDSSGVPTDLYNDLRSSSTSGHAIASVMRNAYKPLFDRDVNAHALSDNALEELIVQETGDAANSSAVKLTLRCFKALREYADFDADDSSNEIATIDSKPQTSGSLDASEVKRSSANQLKIGYTINLNLPATSDPAVFNAIFKSLKEHLLSNDDG